MLHDVTVSHMWCRQMIGLYRDPTGEKIFEKYNGKSSSKGNAAVAVASVAGDSTDSLKKRVKELEELLSSNVSHGQG